MRAQDRKCTYATQIRGKPMTSADVLQMRAREVRWMLGWIDNIVRQAEEQHGRGFCRKTRQAKAGTGEA